MATQRLTGELPKRFQIVAMASCWIVWSAIYAALHWRAVVLREQERYMANLPFVMVEYSMVLPLLALTGRALWKGVFRADLPMLDRFLSVIVLALALFGSTVAIKNFMLPNAFYEVRK